MASRSPFHLAMKLILAVTIVFLILLIIIYIVASQHKPKCAPCKSIAADDSITTKHSHANPKLDTEILPIVKETVEKEKLQYKTEYSICPNDVKGFLKYPFVVAIIQALYANHNSSSGQRYLGSGAIITHSHVITSLECLDSLAYDEIIDSVLIRAGSSYWSKEGILHNIKKVLYQPAIDDEPQVDSLLIILHLEFPLLQMKTISPIKIAPQTIFREGIEGEAFGWVGSDKVDYTFRAKYDVLSPRIIEVYKEDCRLYKDQQNTFCGRNINPPGFCDHITGAPVVLDEYLLGIQIKTSCKASKNEYYFIDVAYLYKWVKLIGKFY